MRRDCVQRSLRGTGSAVATAALLFSAAGPACADSGQGQVELPAIASALAPGAACTAASGRTAQAQPWTVNALGLTGTQQLTQGGGVTVAVVDTGVGTGVPALAGRVTALGDAGQDCVGHGSFAAGLIGAARLPGVGVFGVAPQVSILAVRGTNERGATDADLVAGGIRAAVEHGASVVYVGEALPAGSPALTAAVDAATQDDALVVAAAAPDSAPVDGAGATPDPTARPYFPAFLPQVLSVEDYGADGSRPSGAPNVFAADLAAPGDAVVSVGPQGGGHFIGSGSSLAAATVAGAAALVRAYHPQLTAAQVRRQLIASGYPGGVPLLDPYAAVTAVLGTAVPAAPSLAVAPARMAPVASAAPLHRALVIAAVGGALLLVVATAAVLIPLGRARGWRPANR